MTGRLTLSSSVLSAIPTYFMQTALLPSPICERIDSASRLFLWGAVFFIYFLVRFWGAVEK